MDIVKHGLNDENQKVKTITALTIAALAEAASPYGIESFDDVLEPLWKGIRLLRGKARPALSCPYSWMQGLITCLDSVSRTSNYLKASKFFMACLLKALLCCST